jgi:2-polyprenyl-3-methyl-5-hydroxy-6-metoxy-1,4-benzoquinol methylase
MVTSSKKLHTTDDYQEENITKLADARNHFWYIHRNKVIDSLISEFLKVGLDILELGAGSGNISTFLSEKGYAVVASDFYQSSIDIMKDKGIKAFQYDMINDSPFPEDHLKAYDAVILADVIEHLDDPVKALKNAKKFLKKDGKILITAPAQSILWTKYDDFCRHKRRYSAQQLVEHLRLAGYTPVKVRYFMFLVGTILFVTRRIKNYLSKSGKSDYSKELVINPIINNIMKVFMNIEYFLQRVIYIPYGSSIYGLALIEK